MAGHVGERRNRTVALVTEDLRLYHRLVPVFETQGIPLLGLRPDEDVPETVEVLLDGPDEDPRSLAVLAHDEATLLAVLQRLDPRPTARGPDGYSTVIVGADPGDAIGLAVVADGQALLVAQARSPQQAVERVALWRTGLQCRSLRMHVGDGAPEVGAAILEQAQNLLPGVPTALVPEADTTPRAPVTGSRHTDAAIHIALRRA